MRRAMKSSLGSFTFTTPLAPPTPTADAATRKSSKKLQKPLDEAADVLNVCPNQVALIAGPYRTHLESSNLVCSCTPISWLRMDWAYRHTPQNHKKRVNSHLTHACSPGCKISASFRHQRRRASSAPVVHKSPSPRCVWLVWLGTFIFGGLGQGKPHFFRAWEHLLHCPKAALSSLAQMRQCRSCCICRIPCR